jgi:dihydrofolate reductase
VAALVLKMSVSLDGYVAALDGSTDWAAAGRSEDGAGWTAETVGNAGAHLMGAATYAEWAAYWPGASGPFAQAMNGIPKVVFSNSLTSADWPGTTIATGDLAEAVTRLKQERGEGYLLAQGGVRFARSLVGTGLIDEYRLVVHPVVLGAAERLFTAPLTARPRRGVAPAAAAERRPGVPVRPRRAPRRTSRRRRTSWRCRTRRPAGAGR